MMKEYSILNMGIIGYALFKPSVGNVWGLFIEFEIIHGSRLSAVSLSYEDSDWSRFRFYKVSQYGYICYKLPNSLSLCSVCYHEPKKKKKKNKSINEWKKFSIKSDVLLLRHVCWLFWWQTLGVLHYKTHKVI